MLISSASLVLLYTSLLVSVSSFQIPSPGNRNVFLQHQMGNRHNSVFTTTLHMKVAGNVKTPRFTPGAQTTLGGKIAPVLSNLKLNGAKLKKIQHGLATDLDPGGFVLLSVVWWLALPSMRILFNILQKRCKTNDAAAKEGRQMSAFGKFIKAISPPSYRRQMNFEDSLVFQVGDHVTQLCKLGTLIYAADVVAIILRELGFVAFGKRLQITFAKVPFAIWLAWRLNKFKRFLLSKRVRRKNTNLGKAEVYDRILSLVLYAFTGLVVMDQLSAEWGVALTSVAAFGGVGTLVVSLAAKDLAAQFLNGLALNTSDNFYAGDSVRFGDGTSGSIVKIGWMHTLVKGSDEAIVKIPNSQIVNQRVTNLSRVRRSQVKQTLRFQYADIDKIPKLVRDIKTTMKREFADELVQDKELNVHWLDLAHDHLQVVCDLRFDLPPTSSNYLALKERVITTLASVVSKNGMEFALPSVVSRNFNMSARTFNDFEKNVEIQIQQSDASTGAI